MVTGVVLRAFAVHQAYRQLKEAQRAGELLLLNLFKRDHYPDRESILNPFILNHWHKDFALSGLKRIVFYPATGSVLKS